MMTRQMLSTVSRGRIPAWRSTSRRIMSASRAGRNAEPDSVVFFVLYQAADDLAALHQEGVHRRVDAVDLGTQFGEVGRARAHFLNRQWRLRGFRGRAIHTGGPPRAQENIDRVPRHPI